MPAKRQTPRAIIIGGSMGGLFSAAFLRQIGWQADVYERSQVELVGRGAGITTHPELLEALEKSGAGTHDLGVEVEKRIALDRHGRVIAEKHLSRPGTDCSGSCGRPSTRRTTTSATPSSGLSRTAP